MATRSIVAVEGPGGTYRSMYHHWDGYPEGLGAHLNAHYGDAGKARRLVNGGDRSTILPREGHVRPPRRDPSDRRTGAQHHHDFESVKTRAYNQGADYVHILNRGSNRWKSLSVHSDPAFEDVSHRQGQALAKGVHMGKLSEALAPSKNGRKLGDAFAKKSATADPKFEPVPGHHDAFLVKHPSVEGLHHVIHPYGDDVVAIHEKGDKQFHTGQFGLGPGHPTAMKAAISALDQKRQGKAMGQRAASEAEHARQHGNEYTGDISGLHNVMHVHGVEGNWVRGATKDGQHDVHLKVFNEGSDYGIGRGRVSSLSVQHRATKDWAVNYDRGWDQKPQTDDHKQFVRDVRSALDKGIKKTDVDPWDEPDARQQDNGIVKRADPENPHADIAFRRAEAAVENASKEGKCVCASLPEKYRQTGHHPNCDKWDPHAAPMEKRAPFRALEGDADPEIEKSSRCQADRLLVDTAAFHDGKRWTSQSQHDRLGGRGWKCKASATHLATCAEPMTDHKIPICENHAHELREGGWGSQRGSKLEPISKREETT